MRKIFASNTLIAAMHDAQLMIDQGRITAARDHLFNKIMELDHQERDLKQFHVVWDEESTMRTLQNSFK